MTVFKALTSYLTVLFQYMHVLPSRRRDATSADRYTLKCMLSQICLGGHHSHSEDFQVSGDQGEICTQDWDWRVLLESTKCM